MFWGIFVTKDGDALKFVSFELILDREIVLCAVRDENFYLDDEESVSYTHLTLPTKA